MLRWWMLALLAMAGCSATTETGYEPRRLGDSEAARRGYYAAPFSPGANAAEMERRGESSRPPASRF